MKANVKRLKALGRKYAKQAFHLTENDCVELSMLERAYLNGYKQCLKELKLKEIDGHEIVLTNRIFAPLEQIGKFLKNNVISSFHEDIDKAVANEDYKELLKYINIVENTLTNLKKKLVISILEK